MAGDKNFHLAEKASTLAAAQGYGTANDFLPGKKTAAKKVQKKVFREKPL